jgi:acyl-CoA synthetase (AMP-forming)/AMP-acid ligase II
MTNHARLYEALSPIQVYAPAKFESIPHAMARNARAHPDRRLLLCEGRSVTWGEFDRRVNRVANALLAMGLQKRDKVAVLASTCPGTARCEPAVASCRCRPCPPASSWKA